MKYIYSKLVLAFIVLIILYTPYFAYYNSQQSNDKIENSEFLKSSDVLFSFNDIKNEPIYHQYSYENKLEYPKEKNILDDENFVEEQETIVPEEYHIEEIATEVEHIQTSKSVNNYEVIEAEPYEYTDSEIELLCKVIYAEAVENDLTSYQYVGAVVMNRVDYGYWGDTIHDVVYADGQYACTWNGSYKFSLSVNNIPEDVYLVAEELLSGERYGVPESVIFQAGFPQGSGTWLQYGNTYFCHWLYHPNQL